MYLLFGHSNVLWRVSSDKNLLWVPSLSSFGTVSVNLRERMWEVDSSIRCRLDKLDVLAGSTANDSVKGEFEHRSIDHTSELEEC